MTAWLVTGGAGYIGAHVVEALLASGRQAVVFDDFSSGLERRVPDGAPIVRGSVHDHAALTAAFAEFGISGVVHLAAKKAAGESVDVPLYYFRENVGGMLTLLEAMRDAGVARLVYSSSASVYGEPDANPVTEAAALRPESPYGQTKVVGEWMAADSGVAWGLSWAALRYFNVAGSGSDELGDNSVGNLIPMVFRALDRGERPQVFGDDYPTADGTCIRDYVHVVDLAEAHAAAAALCEEHAAAAPFNVGRGVGSSVREVLDVIATVIGRDLDAEVVGRRPGDPPASFAATGLIEAELGWRASRDLTQMVDSAWSAWRAYPADSS
ncbi:MAG: UDP-glucose 4-epimerase GalE [Candidatus Nanopelagicales bacterium]